MATPYGGPGPKAKNISTDPEKGSKLNTSPSPEKNNEGQSRDQREAQIKLQSERDLGDIALETRGEQSEAVLISHLRLDVPAESQKASVERFDFNLSFEVIPTLLAAGATAEQLSVVTENPQSLHTLYAQLHTAHPEKFEKWDRNLTTQTSFAKLIEVFSHPGTFSNSWKIEWMALLGQSASRYKQATAMRDNHPLTWEHTKEIGHDTVKWVKNNKTTTALILGGALVAGWLFKKIFFSKDEPKAEAKPEQATNSGMGGTISTWGKRLLLGSAGVGAIWLLSKILPTDKIEAWAKGIYDESFLGRALGSAEEKAEAKTENKKEQNDFYKDIAEKMGIEDPELLSAFGEYEYDSFTSLLGQGTGAVANKAKKTFAESVWGNLAEVDTKLLPDSVRSFFKKQKEYPEKVAAAEDKLREFLTKHKEVIDKQVYPRKYVKEVLEGLGREGIFGEEYKKKPMKVDPMVVPVDVQAKIHTKYGTVEIQNKATTLAIKVFEKQDEEVKNTFGKNGLVERLDHMAQKNPSYREKIAKVKAAYEALSQKRASFADALAKGTPLNELEAMVPEVQKVEEEFLDTCTDYYAEIEPHMTWTPLLFFVRRYAMMTPHKKAAAREQVRRLFLMPKGIRDAYKEGREPIAFYTNELRAAKEEQSLLARTKLPSPQTAAEFAQKNSKVEALEKRLTFEEKRLELSKLSEAERSARHGELIALEKEYIEANQKALGGSIEYAKEFLKDAGANVSDREKIQFIQNIKIENAALGRSIKAYEERILKEVERLGKSNAASEALILERDAIVAAYRHNVKTELSLISSLKGESSGLRKEFVEWLEQEKKSGLVKLTKNRWGRIGVMGLLLTPGMYFQYRDMKESNPDKGLWDLKEELGKEGIQLLADICPFTFGASDWYTLKTGQEFFTKNKVKGWDRYSHAIWGTMGALLDTAAIIPAVDVVGVPADIIMRTARGMGRAAEGKKMIRLWPRIRSVAEKVGGWKKFGEHLTELRSGATKLEKARAIGGMARVALPRVGLVSYLVGGKVYEGVYTMGDDATEKGVELHPSLVEGIEDTAEPDVSSHQQPLGKTGT